MGILAAFIICIFCMGGMIYSIIWTKKCKCKYTSMYEKDLMYSILDQAETMVVIWKDDLSFLNMNHYMMVKLGYEEKEIQDLFRDLFGIDETNSKKTAAKMLCSNKNIEQEVPYKDGETKYVMWRSVIWCTCKDGVRTILSIGFDITEKVKLTSELNEHMQKIQRDAEVIQKLAFEDELTGLYNKRKFMQEGRWLLQNIRLEQKYALIYISIDKFSFLSNIYGQKVGENIIKKTSRIIRQLTPKEGICARKGEDEFTLLIPIKSQSDITLLCEGLAAHVSKIQIKPHIKYKLELLSAAAIYPDHGNSVEELYGNAAFAIEDMKIKGSKTLQVFDNNLKETIIKREVMAMELQEAINNNEFILYYQPKVDIRSNELVGMEALIRWKHPKKGFISPGEFIAIAEKTGLIIEIGKWALIEACRQNKLWQNRGYKKYRASVNISAIEFYQENMLEIIKEALNESCLDAEYLEIELTESMALINETETIQKLMDIKGMGINVALDDFGTGYSSLSYLKTLPIDVLKLDRSFIIEIVKDDISKEIVFTMIKLAEILNIKTVAEGVETKEQAELLKEMGCSIIQGYYYNRAVPPDLFEDIYLKGKKEIIL